MRILVVGEQPIFCEGLSSIAARLEGRPDISVLLGPDAFAQAETQDADLYLVEITDDATPLDALRRFASVHAAKTVVFSGKESPSLIRDVMELGVRGFIPKSLGINLILAALCIIERGGRYIPDAMLSEATADLAPSRKSAAAGYGTLTGRQREVLHEMSKGRTNRDIADTLHISIATVKLHVNAVLKNLHVRNRTEAALIAQRLCTADLHV